MLIPPSQEFDPGTIQHNNGRVTMNEIVNVVSTTSATITSAPVPHRYQYPLDVPRIFRVLRPLKAKISAIELAIKSAPSYGYSSNSNNNNNNSTLTNTTHRHDRNTRHSRRSRSQDEEQESRPRRGGTEQDYGRRTAASASLHNTETTTSTGSTSARSGKDLLIKRFQSSLTDVFRDLIEKYWWQPICDDYDLPLNSSLSKVVSMGINPSQYTLGMTCAFAVGRIIAALPGDQAILVDKYYNIIPESMRRFALLEHAVRMCTSSIAIKDMLKPLAELCVRYRADGQALHILEHLLVNQDELFQLDYRWAYIVASRVDCADTWVKIWAQMAPISFFTSRQFSAFTQELPQHGATLIQASIKIHMHGTGTDLPDRTRRARSVRFATSLIQESLKLHERLAEGHGNVLQTALLSRREKHDGGIECLAKSLFKEHEMQPESWQKGVALALALHSLYSTVTTSPESTTIFDGMSSWVDLLENRATIGICASDFNVVIQAYGTLVNLNSLALMLDAVGLYSLSMELIDRMLTEFYELDDATCRQLGYPCDVTIQSLESLHKEVEQRRMQHAREDGWRYDDVMETWVEVTPKADKTLTLPIIDFIDTDGCDSEGEEQDNHPASPTRNRYRNPSGSTSRDATSKYSQQHAKVTPQPTPHSPFVMRRPIRYSMTPVRRSDRLGRRLGRYSDSGGESESEMDADEGVYVAPMDLEVLARFTIEEDSENEDQPGHELQSFSVSELENSSSDSATRSGWSGRSNNPSSESEQSTDEDSEFDNEDDEVLYEGGNDVEAVGRPSRRRPRENEDAQVLSPQIIILSDSSQQSDTDLQDSDGNGTFNDVEEDTYIASDDNSQFSNNDESSSERVMMARGRCRHVSKSETEDDSGKDDDSDGSEHDVYVISDDDDDDESSKDPIESGKEAVDEASSEYDCQPIHRKRPSQRPSLHRNILNTPESEPDIDTQDDSDEPIHQRKSVRQAQRRNNIDKQEQYSMAKPPPSPQQGSSEASPSRIQLRKKRPQSYSFSTGFSSPSDDDGMVSDFQESIKESRSRSSRFSRTSRLSTSTLRAKHPPLSSRHSKVATKVATKVSTRSSHASRDHHSKKEIPDSSEDSAIDEFVSTRTLKSNARSTFTYSTRSVSTSHSNKGAEAGGQTMSRRKRIIVYDDDVSDDDVSDDNSDYGRSDTAPVRSPLRVTRTQVKKRTAAGSDVSDSLPRTRTRSRPVATQSHVRKRIRIEEEDDISDDSGKFGSEHVASTRKVNRKPREGRGSVSRRTKMPVNVAEDSLDDTDDFE